MLVLVLAPGLESALVEELALVLVPALAWVLVLVPVLVQELVLARVLVPVQPLVAGQLLGLLELE